MKSEAQERYEKAWELLRTTHLKLGTKTDIIYAMKNAKNNKDTEEITNILKELNKDKFGNTLKKFDKGLYHYFWQPKYFPRTGCRICQQCWAP